MKAFAELLDRLTYTPGRNDKLRLLAHYFRTTPDPDRGWALAALTDGLPWSFPVRRTLLDLVATRIDPVLFALSRDDVGDTAETVSLIWPSRQSPAMPADSPRLDQIADRLLLIHPHDLGHALEEWLDHLDANGRWALLKLLTGALRVGVSARLAKTAVASVGAIPISEIEEVWHGQTPPYASLFQWIERKAPRPDVTGAPVFRPLMLAQPLEPGELDTLDIADLQIEWKWDGIRVQLASTPAGTRLFSRSGEEISASFPEIVEGWPGHAVLDGELIVMREGTVAPFADLQKRLGRRSVSRRILQDSPTHVRLYDILSIGTDDLRALPLTERRRHLEQWVATHRPIRADLSNLVTASDRAELHRIWTGTRGIGIEGLMLKRRASPYIAGRPKGHWWKWKRATLTLDCVLLYAQRGSGKRSSYYSDYTFGLWRDGSNGEPELVPVGKAYSGFTDEELLKLDRFVRNNTTEQYGPVRQVRPLLVMEIEFDAVQRSARHRSGVAMRFPRVHRIRWDKPAAEADRLAAIEALIDEPKQSS